MAESLIGTASGMKILSQIGELRLQRQTIERHLNLAQEKRELEVAFKEYFARQGVQDVTEEMIQQAIETYKQNRFTLPAWKGSSFGRMLAGAYIWFQPRTFVICAMTVAITCASIIAVKGLDYAVEVSNARENRDAVAFIGAEVDNFYVSMEKLNAMIADNATWLADQTQKQVVFMTKGRTLSGHAVSELLSDVGRENAELRQTANDLAEWGKTHVVFDKQDLEVDPQGKLANLKNEVYPHIASVRERLDILRASISEKRQRIERLTEIETGLRASKEKGLPTHLPEVALKLVSVERLLAEGNDLEAKKAYQELNLAVGRSAAVEVLAKSISTLETSLSSTFKDDEGRKKFADLIGQAKAQAARGDQDGYRKTAKAIESLALYVSTNLHFQFVNRNGVQTGFARTNDSTGNKRWYLVVEAVDATGTPFEMDIYNSETRQSDKVRLWGQEVPASVFEKVRNDKQSDGILDDTDLGDKPAGNYTVDYRKTVLKTQVTRWSK